MARPFPQFGSIARLSALLACAFSATLAWSARAEAYYLVQAQQASSGSLPDGDDSTCNLAEAIYCANRGDNCVGYTHCPSADPSSPTVVYLSGQLINGQTPKYLLTVSPVVTATVYLDCGDNPGDTIIESSDTNGTFVVNATGDLTLQTCQAQHAGTGRVATNHGFFTVYNSIVQNGNVASLMCHPPANTSGCGGGIFSDGPSLQIYGSTVQNNSATKGGGVFLDHIVNSAGLDADQSLFTNNRAVNSNNDVTTGGTVTSTGTVCNSSTENNTKAFDDNPTTKWCVNNSSTPTITYQLTAAQTITAYSVTSANDHNERDPKSWTLQGSNNGTNWTTLDTQTNQAFMYRFHTKYYSFSNGTAWNRYRLNVTANNGGGSLTQLAEIQLFVTGDGNGEGGALYMRDRLHATNLTFSGNLAGCTSTSCKCSLNNDWCASTTATSSLWGAGGAIYHEPPGGQYLEMSFSTLVANSAPTGGGVFQAVPLGLSGHTAHSIVANNKRRIAYTNTAETGVGLRPPIDFGGYPHGDVAWRDERNLYSSFDGVNGDTGTTYTDEAWSAAILGVCPILAKNGTQGHTKTHKITNVSKAYDRDNNGFNLLNHDQRGDTRPEFANYDVGAFELSASDDVNWGSCP
jgi:NedA-like, galactose-binding domain